MSVRVERMYRVLDEVVGPNPATGHGMVLAPVGAIITEEQALTWGVLQPRSRGARTADIKKES